MGETPSPMFTSRVTDWYAPPVAATVRDAAVIEVTAGAGRDESPGARASATHAGKLPRPMGR